MYDLYSKKEKIYFLICGILIALGLSITTYFYFKSRVISMQWEQSFTTPKEYWSKVPKWEWKPVFKEDKLG